MLNYRSPYSRFIDILVIISDSTIYVDNVGCVSYSWIHFSRCESSFLVLVFPYKILSSIIDFHFELVSVSCRKSDLFSSTPRTGDSTSPFPTFFFFPSSFSCTTSIVWGQESRLPNTILSYQARISLLASSTSSVSMSASNSSSFNRILFFPTDKCFGNFCSGSNNLHCCRVITHENFSSEVSWVLNSAFRFSKI